MGIEESNAEIILSAFEKNILERLRSLVTSMPLGTALYTRDIRRADGSSDLIATRGRTFRVIPSRSGAAELWGIVEGDVPNDQSLGGEIFLAIGQGSAREFAVGSTDQEVRSTTDLFFETCSGVFAGGFSEQVTYDSEGHIVKSRAVLPVKGRNLVFSSGVILRKPIGRKHKKLFLYEPYR